MMVIENNLPLYLLTKKLIMNIYVLGFCTMP
jgi:hypothetical protein